MKAKTPRIERLKEMLALEERRARLQEDLATLVDRMKALGETFFEETVVRVGRPREGTAARTRIGSGRRAPRGALKEKIMAALESAGAAGVHVRDLALSLATKPVNIHSWFHSTSKRNPAIKKISGGHYRLDTKGTASAAQARPTRKPGKGRPAGRGKGRGRGGQSRRGQLSERIIAELRGAGSKGITVRELADNVGSKYKNIYIWFATTGKKNPSIRKIAPATYRIVG